MRDGFAEAIMLSTGLDHRSRHRVAARAVAAAVQRGEGPDALDPPALDGAAREVLGQPLTVSSELR